MLRERKGGSSGQHFVRRIEETQRAAYGLRVRGGVRLLIQEVETLFPVFGMSDASIGAR